MKFLIMFSIFLYASLSAAQGNWDLAQDEDEIRIYTKPNDTTNHKAFKADMVVQASIEKVNSHMSAMEAHTKWMYNRKLTEVLGRSHDKSTIVYSVTNAPWPVTDRDAVVSFTYSKNNTKDFIRIDFVNVDGYYPINEELVRVPYIKGYWEFIKIDDYSTKIVFMNASSPGGIIPDWLANSFVIDIPYHSLNNLRNILKQTD